MNKINNLANIARNYGITQSDSLRDDIVSEYTNKIDSLNTIDESVIVKDIELLPVYTISEGLFNRNNTRIEPQISPKTVPFKNEAVELFSEECIEPINEILSVDYNATMRYSIGTIKRKMYPISWLKRNRQSLQKRLDKYETDLKNFKKMNDEEQLKFCTKINVVNGAYSAGIAAATNVTSQQLTGGNYSVTYISIPDKITPYNYPGVVEKMIKKLKYDIKKLDDLIKQKEKAKNIKEGYAIDLDSLKSVVESRQLTLEEAIHEIKEANYIGDTFQMYCVLPENINENISLESFITLNEALNKADIIPVSIREYTEEEFIIEGLTIKTWNEAKVRKTLLNMRKI